MKKTLLFLAFFAGSVTLASAQNEKKAKDTKKADVPAVAVQPQHQSRVAPAAKIKVQPAARSLKSSQAAEPKKPQ